MSVYVNRLLNLKKIKVIGFDMDYTLVDYNIDAFEKMTHYLTLRRLVKDYNYPRSISKLKFDFKRAIIGLVIDKKHGNLIKISRFGTVKIAYHGLKEIDFRERSELYRNRVVDLQDADFQCLDTSFEISTGILFSQLVQLKKDGAILPDYRHLAEDIHSCVDSLHIDGTLKNIIKSDFERFVKSDPNTSVMLEQLKSYEKKLILITNSDYSYVKPLLNYAVNPYLKKYRNWQEIFDLVVTSADKPGFFEGNRRFLRIDPETGLMSNHEGEIFTGLWQGGSFEKIQASLNVEGDEFLYLGDHIYGDMVSIKKLCDWRTALVLGELDNEISAIQNSQEIQDEIDRLMNRKTEIEILSDNAELERHYGKNKKISAAIHAEQDELNNRISHLLDKLKPRFNPYWGEILRAGTELSRYAEQVEKYACIYMTRVSDLCNHSPRTYFRPPRFRMPHEFLDKFPLINPQ